MGGKEGGDARISAIVRKWKILWYLHLKRGGMGLTAILEMSHSPGAPTGHGYDYIAWSQSSKARISTTKQHLGNYFGGVKPESVPDLPINCVSTQTAQAHFRTDEQRMSHTHKCPRTWSLDGALLVSVFARTTSFMNPAPGTPGRQGRPGPADHGTRPRWQLFACTHIPDHHAAMFPHTTHNAAAMASMRSVW